VNCAKHKTIQLTSFFLTAIHNIFAVSVKPSRLFAGTSLLQAKVSYFIDNSVAKIKARNTIIH